jgi:hypothetical protein
MDKRLQEYTTKNTVCACCSNKNPRWAVSDWGIVICIECAGIIRSNIGTDICFIRSITLDRWKDDQIEVKLIFNSYIQAFVIIGNELGNKYYEQYLENKPMNSDKQFILDKFERRKYMCFELKHSKTKPMSQALLDYIALMKKHDWRTKMCHFRIVSTWCDIAIVVI